MVEVAVTKGGAGTRDGEGENWVPMTSWMPLERRVHATNLMCYG